MAEADITPAAGDESRERWAGRFSFVMAAIGSAVGLGNLWRFPAVAYANGGGAFFIPYFVALLTAGIPVLVLEFAVGQMMQGSAPKALRKLNRNFEWVGWFALLVGTTIAVYYAVIMAYSWNYLWDSFSASMPWSAGGSGTEGQYFESVFLRATTGPGMWGMRWPVVAGLALTWASVYLIIYKGVHRVGKVVLVTVPLPWIILLVLGLRGLTLEGAAAGVEYYLRPDFEALKNPSTWLAAYSQVFFSLSIGFGIMIAYASYRPRNSDVTNCAFITSFADCLTSFFAGFAVFSVLGFLAYKNGVPVRDVVAGGPSLAFVAYPAAITRMGDLGAIWPPLIGILFFITLLSLGIDSLFSIVEGAGAGFQDYFPKVGRSHVAAAFSLGGFALGLLFCTRGGIAWLDLVDHWANDYGLAMVGLLECLLIGYFFDIHRIRDFANDVSEIKLGGWWELCVKVITPVALVYLVGHQFMKEFVDPYGAGYPVWMQWATRGLFATLIAGALAITRRWSYLALAGIALVAGLATYGIVKPARVKPFVKDVAVVTTDDGREAYDVSFAAEVTGTSDEYLLWDFGDGGAPSTDAAPTHRYAAGGTYKVLVRAHGERGRGLAARAVIEVDVRPFGFDIAEFDRRRTIEDARNPLAYRFKAKAAFGKEPYAYRWKFGDYRETDDAEGTHDFKEAGERTVTVTATDAKGREAAQEFRVRVVPYALVLKADPQGGEVPAGVEFTATLYGIEGRPVEDGGALAGFGFQWDFGDGPARPAEPGLARVTHRYDRVPAEGTVMAGVVVTDAQGIELADRVKVNLREPEDHAPGLAALLSGLGATLLLGGLLLCLLVATRRHGGRAGFAEESRG